MRSWGMCIFTLVATERQFSKMVTYVSVPVSSI